MTPEEMLEYATKFGFPPTKHMRLSIEKNVHLGEDQWLIKNMGTEVFDHSEGKLVFHRITENIPEYYYLSLEDAFYFVDWLIQEEKQKEIDYTGRCQRCGKFVGEINLKEAFGWNWCQECYDKID